MAATTPWYCIYIVGLYIAMGVIEIKEMSKTATFYSSGGYMVKDYNSWLSKGRRRRIWEAARIA